MCIDYPLGYTVISVQCAEKNFKNVDVAIEVEQVELQACDKIMYIIEKDLPEDPIRILKELPVELLSQTIDQTLSSLDRFLSLSQPDDFFLVLKQERASVVKHQLLYHRDRCTAGLELEISHESDTYLLHISDVFQ